MGSQRFSLNGPDAWAVVKGLLIASSGGAIAYLLQFSSTIDQSSTTGIVASVVIAGIVNLIRKFVSDNTSKP